MQKLIVLAMLALAIPAAALAADPTPGTPSQNAAATAACRAQRAAVGTVAFRTWYVGTTNANHANAFGKCISTAVKSAQANNAAAVATCKKQQADPAFATTTGGGKTFNQFYGNGKNGANAFGKCVSKLASAADQANQAATLSAAKSCKAAAADKATFASTYGTKANAFGKCVAATVHATP
jgi:hypothetical protein